MILCFIMKHSSRQIEDTLLTPSEVSVKLKVCQGTIYKLRASGILNPVRLGKRCIRFRLSEVEGLLAGTKKNSF